MFSRTKSNINIIMKMRISYCCIQFHTLQIIRDGYGADVYGRNESLGTEKMNKSSCTFYLYICNVMYYKFMFMFSNCNYVQDD